MASLTSLPFEVLVLVMKQLASLAGARLACKQLRDAANAIVDGVAIVESANEDWCWLKDHSSCIRVLWFGRIVSHDPCQEVTKLLRSLPALTAVYIPHSDMRMAVRVAHAISGYRIQHLCLDHSILGCRGAHALVAPLMRMAPTLRGLSMTWCRVRTSGAAALARALRQMAALQYLRLDSNPLRTTGLRALARALPRMTSLQRLDLSDTEIGPSGMMALAPAIGARGATLTDLSLGCHNSGAEGAVALAAQVPRLTSLIDLDISTLEVLFNDASGVLVEPLSQLLPTLRHLSVELDSPLAVAMDERAREAGVQLELYMLGYV